MHERDTFNPQRNLMADILSRRDFEEDMALVGVYRAARW